MLSVLDTIDSWIAEIPPVHRSLRYGNPAFRDLFDRLQSVRGGDGDGGDVIEVRGAR